MIDFFLHSVSAEIKMIRRSKCNSRDGFMSALDFNNQAIITLHRSDNILCK